MASEQTDHLFKLIKSLSKSEKRSFKLHVKRSNKLENTKFIKLFDILEKQTEYNEALVLKKAPEIIPQQISNLKAHLYKTILASLRQNSSLHDVDISIRQQLDYAKILYDKALYRQSLKILEKAAENAQNNKRDVLMLEIIEFEKLIESQYITNSINRRSDELTTKSFDLSKQVNNSAYFSNLSLKLYGYYLRIGYIRNQKDYMAIENFFHSYIKAKPKEPDTFFDRLHYYQAHVWYYLIIQDFLNVYKNALQWVRLFDENPKLKYTHTDLYFKGYNNLLTSLYFIGQYTKFNIALSELKEFLEDSKLPNTVNNKLLGFKYLYENLINKHFLEGSFTEGIKIIPEIDEYLNSLQHHIDAPWEAVIHYKLACLLFGAAKYKEALKFLHKVINSKDESINNDIQSFSRILALISHYELGDTELLDYQTKSVYRYLLTQKDLYQVQKILLKFLRKFPYISREEAQKQFPQYLNSLKELRKDRYESRPFLYLDIISWLESKIEKIPVEIVIQRKWREKGK